MLGGRARGVIRDGLPLDNGEHLLLGAYAETLRLAAIVHDGRHASPWITAPLAIRPFSPHQRNALSLRARQPAGTVRAARRRCSARTACRGASESQRSAGSRVCAPAAFDAHADATVADLLPELPARVRDDLWAPLCLAALNTPPARASAQVFLNVLRESFGGAADAAEMVVPRNGLAAAFPERAAQWLTRARPWRPHRRRDARSSRRRMTCASPVRRGETRADAAIVAVGPHQLAAAFDPALAASDAGIAAALHHVAAIRVGTDHDASISAYGAGVRCRPDSCDSTTSPANGCSIARDILVAPRRLAIDARHRARCFRSCISAHGAHDTLDHPALVAAVDRATASVEPALPPLGWSQVIAEKRATYACVPSRTHPACGRLSGPHLSRGRLHVPGVSRDAGSRGAQRRCSRARRASPTLPHEAARPMRNRSPSRRDQYAEAS